ncbi:MAG: class II glutamine amidotransferase [Pirellulales bacterium]|nr:class II glutamine amidotransferase [Pirellulales bacterium]
MCRWLAYQGPAVTLSSLLVRPNHSLIDQSRHARENVYTTNGDGLGVGWYGAERVPGVYRDTHPAWNDTNFRSLADHVQSPLFLAHVRAATGAPVQKTNCHPFTYDRWLFQHNGAIPEFDKLRRQFMFDVEPSLFPYIEGSTDSEILFFLALTFGLQKDPPAALSRTMGYVTRAVEAAGINLPFFFSACVTDGERLWAVRYSSNHQSRTLYHSCHIHALKEVDGTYGPLPDDGVIVVSEPLDELAEHWAEVPESSLLTAEGGSTAITPFSVS